ncbi:MAG: AMP-binding protein [Candidatus Cloacimonetes bacterium]|nr:AMP-binding protein [Candidatus Cloacimonadota bacterium]MCF7814227.1 AMP-binding protein [Candidatus Cloacimonadota bacterium]MCF7868114.1 AMP-binding protein [Candidatus Cloacimonadota bacterium]MCF7883580.1 AMP-binding protein [Candidatus Cloacimonadota bacterium]
MQLHHKFIKTAKKFPKKVSVHDIATGKDVIYERMLIIALIFAKKFKKIDSKYVGVMVPTSAGCMLTNIGLLMAGKIPVMINYATGAIENSIYAQDKCNFETIICSRKLLQKLKLEPIDSMIFLEDIAKDIKITDKLGALLKSKRSAKSLKKIVHQGDDDETAVILFTSGSEKEPKAVQLTHKSIGHNVDNIPKIIDLDPSHIFLANLPLFHVFGITANFWLPITLGTSIVAYPNPLDYKIICGLIKKYKVTLMAGTPSFYYGYLKKSSPGDFESMQFAISGADTLTKQIYDGFLEKHDLIINNAYGTTETSPAISINTPNEQKFGSVGKPIPGVKVKILDVDTDEELPANQTGKILVKGDMVMKGYLHDLEETSLRIHKGWYDTGDMGYMDDDGYLWHKGRLKRFVKVGGEMVSLVRVEEVLNKYLPDDVICCVVDVPNPTKGADVVAAVTTGKIDQRQILKKMAKELPGIAVPKEFYILEEIPMMGSGKVNFREVEKTCRKLKRKGKIQ